MVRDLRGGSCLFSSQSDTALSESFLVVSSGCVTLLSVLLRFGLVTRGSALRVVSVSRESTFARPLSSL